jgi:hypothetical protein
MLSIWSTVTRSRGAERRPAHARRTPGACPAALVLTPLELVTKIAALVPSSRHRSGTLIPASARFRASMIWLSVNLDFFM